MATGLQSPTETSSPEAIFMHGCGLPRVTTCTRRTAYDASVACAAPVVWLGEEDSNLRDEIQSLGSYR